MPLIQVTVIEGRSQEKKENFCRQITKLAEENLDVKAAQVRVIINEVPANSWFIGGVSKEELDKTER